MLQAWEITRRGATSETVRYGPPNSGSKPLIRVIETAKRHSLCPNPSVNAWVTPALLTVKVRQSLNMSIACLLS
jgi:hypothetical protein